MNIHRILQFKQKPWIKLRTSEKLINKNLSDPGLINRRILDANLVATHMFNETILLNKPTYFGLAISEVSKELLYDFHHKFF